MKTIYLFLAILICALAAPASAATLYYAQAEETPGKHRIYALVRDIHMPLWENSINIPIDSIYIDEIEANRAILKAIHRDLYPPAIPYSTEPAPAPEYWIDDSGQIVNSLGEVQAVAADPDRQNLRDQYLTALDFLQDIQDNPATNISQANAQLRGMSIILEKMLKLMKAELAK